MTEFVRVELAHAAYRRARAWIDEVDGNIGGGLVGVIEEVLTVALPLCGMTSVALESGQLRRVLIVKLSRIAQFSSSTLTSAKSRVQSAPQVPPHIMHGRISA